ncbi:MAG: thiosulfate/3-mercaptopyruvate sulfurtransferase [Bradymonadia bacterium]|jgi:thiosulfate/3-mercaptopyruvate sulfurtransferase
MFLIKSIKKLRDAVILLASILLAACAVRAGNAQDTATSMPSPVDDEEAVEAIPVFSGIFVTAQEGNEALQAGALFLDARPIHQFLISHPAGAVQISWDDFSDPDERGRLHPDSDLLSERLGALGVSAERQIVVAGGWDTNWGEEARIYWMLRSVGLENVAIVTGGVGAWANAGLDTSWGRQSSAPEEFSATRDTSVAASIDQLAEADLVLDTRTLEEFEGATLYGESRGGHVPGALHIHWPDLLEEGSLPTAEALEARLGVGPEARVTAYCTGGVRSAFVWALLENAGYRNATNYAGSWWEYAESDLPVD